MDGGAEEEAEGEESASVAPTGWEEQDGEDAGGSRCGGQRAEWVWGGYLLLAERGTGRWAAGLSGRAQRQGVLMGACQGAVGLQSCGSCCWGTPPGLGMNCFVKVVLMC
jgi:hypothetical protein